MLYLNVAGYLGQPVLIACLGRQIDHHPVQVMGARLDNPVWHALSKTQRTLGSANHGACRYLARVAPFAATATPKPEAFLALQALLGQDDHVIVQSLSPLAVRACLHAVQLGAVHQMIALEAPPDDPVDGLVRLGRADTEDMLRLAQQTRPGPFARRTQEMGRYIGIRDQGKLIAMAGERMRLEGFVEISAVCVDDGYRGRGLAGRLVNVLRREILLRGDIPFLHVLDDNAPALALYRRLGFENRQAFLLYRLDRCDVLSQ